MAKLKPLLSRPPLLPEETLASYLHRLANANLLKLKHLEEMIQGMSHKRDKISHPQQAETFNQLFQLTGLQGYELFWSSEHSFTRILIDQNAITELITLDNGFTFPLLPKALMQVHLRGNNSAQYCPACLSEGNYQRRVWRLQVVAACIYHKCLLIDCCPKCKSRLFDFDVISGTCGQCGSCLEDANTYDLSDDSFGLSSQGILYHWLNAGSRSYLPIPEFSPREIYSLTHDLLRLVMMVQNHIDNLHPIPDIASPFEWGRKKMHPTVLYVAWATALKGVLNWPKNIHEFFHSWFYADNESYSSKLMFKMGRVLSEVVEKWPIEKNQKIHKEIIKFLRTNCAWYFTLNTEEIHSLAIEEIY